LWTHMRTEISAAVIATWMASCQDCSVKSLSDAALLIGSWKGELDSCEITQATAREKSRRSGSLRRADAHPCARYVDAAGAPHALDDRGRRGRAHQRELRTPERRCATSGPGTRAHRELAERPRGLEQPEGHAQRTQHDEGGREEIVQQRPVHVHALAALLDLRWHADGALRAAGPRGRGARRTLGREGSETEGGADARSAIA
jgi:hypothetical protein